MKYIINFGGLIILILISSNLYSQRVYPLSRNDSALLVQYKKAYQDQYDMGHIKEASKFLNLSAMLYWERNHFDEAETKFLSSLKINKQLANQNGIAMINNNLAMIYADKKEYKKSLNYFEETLLARRVGKEKIGIISALINQSVVYNNLKQYDASVKNLKEALDLAREMNDPVQMRSCYGMLSETYQKAGNIKQSMYYYDYFRTFNDIVISKRIKKSRNELKNERLHRELAELEKRNKELELSKTEKKLEETKYEVKIYSKNQRELLETLSKQEMSLRIVKQEAVISEFENEKLKNEKKRQRNIIAIISIALIIIAVFSLFLFRLYRQKNKYNKLLLLKNAEIHQQKEEIETQKEELERSNTIIAQKNESITQSINYAKYIQTAMLNRKEFFSNFISESFIFFMPRDIVSGDFYWYAKIKEKIFIIVSDCTGHGVPGAFISMAGNNLLTDIIEHQNIHDPADILFNLNKGIVEALNQKHSDNSDGMDIAICVIDEKNKKLEYAGAKAPIIVFQNNELNYVEPDRKSIGGIEYLLRNKKEKIKERIKQFTTKEIDISNIETSIYMFSDGIIDQFDKTNNKKFSRKRLKETLREIQNLSMEEQKKELQRIYSEWKGRNEQTDDMTIIGFKLSFL